ENKHFGSMYTTPIEAFAINILKRTNVLPENTVFLEKCFEKHLVSGEAICPNKKCNKVIETFLSPELLKRSQDKSTTLTVKNTDTKQVDSENPTPIGEDANAIYINEQGLLGGEGYWPKTTEVAKETSDQATSPIEVSTLVERGPNDAQKKCSREDSEGIKLGESTEKLSSKKAKKTSGKKVSSTLKKFIKELLSDVEPIPGRSLEETNNIALNTRGIFLQLSNKIDSTESKNKDASHALISSYFDFGEALFNQYKELKLTYGKERARVLVKSEVRKEIPETKLSDDALRKRMERARKIHRIFNAIGKEKIERIASTPPGLILNLTGDDTDYVIAE
ncbi:27094_t:CDS:2, partial [Gigaspora margarita]